ncbi:Telomeric repeat-binding factor 2-interacting protein 1 [Chamberlinius hualienensis]
MVKMSEPPKRQRSSETFKHSTTLFVGSDNTPMVFTMRPCTERARIQPMIEHGGGIITTNSSNGIRLAMRGSIVTRSNVFASDFIDACVKSDRFLDVKKFPINMKLEDSDETDDDFPRSSSNRQPPSVKNDENKLQTLMFKRRGYSYNEQMTMLKYICKNKLQSEIGGNQIWKRMEEKNLLRERSWQSMKEHFRKKVLPQLHSYKISDNDKDQFFEKIMCKRLQSPTFKQKKAPKAFKPRFFKVNERSDESSSDASTPSDDSSGIPKISQNPTKKLFSKKQELFVRITPLSNQSTSKPILVPPSKPILVPPSKPTVSRSSSSSDSDDVKVELVSTPSGKWKPVAQEVLISSDESRGPTPCLFEPGPNSDFQLRISNVRTLVDNEVVEDSQDITSFVQKPTMILNMPTTRSSQIFLLTQKNTGEMSPNRSQGDLKPSTKRRRIFLFTKKNNSKIGSNQSQGDNSPTRTSSQTLSLTQKSMDGVAPNRSKDVTLPTTRNISNVEVAPLEVTSKRSDVISGDDSRRIRTYSRKDRTEIRRLNNVETATNDKVNESVVNETEGIRLEPIGNAHIYVPETVSTQSSSGTSNTQVDLNRAENNVSNGSNFSQNGPKQPEVTPNQVVGENANEVPIEKLAAAETPEVCGNNDQVVSQILNTSSEATVEKISVVNNATCSGTESSSRNLDKPTQLQLIADARTRTSDERNVEETTTNEENTVQRTRIESTEVAHYLENCSTHFSFVRQGNDQSSRHESEIDVVETGSSDLLINSQIPVVGTESSDLLVCSQRPKIVESVVRDHMYGKSGVNKATEFTQETDVMEVDNDVTEKLHQLSRTELKLLLLEKFSHVRSDSNTYLKLLSGSTKQSLVQILRHRPPDVPDLHFPSTSDDDSLDDDIEFAM